MTTKYTPLNKTSSPLPLSPVRNSAYRFCFGTYTGFLPARVPLHVSNLKPKTRYKVFVRSNDDQGPQEDVTKFCRAVGASLVENPRDDEHNYLISTNAGSLSVEVASIGTSTIDPATESWAAYWRHQGTKTPGDDLNRSDFIVVEAALVENPNLDSKYKIINVSKPASITTPIINESIEDRYVKQELIADYVQTFFVDPNAVENAKTVDLTNVTLFFRTKPERTNNKSGIASPGVVVALVDVENDKPIVGRQYKGSVVQKAWGSITVTGDATAGTKFVFDDIVRVVPGKFYAIAVVMEDPDYDIWACRVGDLLVGTNTPSAGPNKDHRGALFQLTNESTTLSDTNFDTLYTAQADRDLKFDIEVARYNTSEPIKVDMINRPIEFLTIGLNNGNWHGGEYVYVDAVGFSATGLSITAGSYELTYTSSAALEAISLAESFVVREGSRVTVLAIEYIDTTNKKATLVNPSPFSFTESATIIRTAIGIVDYFDPYNNEMFVLDSTARPSYLFAAESTIIGTESGTQANIVSVNEFPVSVFSTNLDLELPNMFDVSATHQFALPGQSGFEFRPDLQADDTLLREPNYVTEYRANVLSRSIEVADAATLNNNASDPYSTKHTLTFTSSTPTSFSYMSPEIEIESMSLVSHFWVINDDATNEHTNQGNALTKHISNKLTFDRGEAAEDIRVVVNAYKPAGTEVLLYAKISNNQDGDPFDDKNWTPLVVTSGAGQVSDSNNQYDYKEFEFGFPAGLDSTDVHPGAFASTLGSADIVCTDAVALAEGDIVKLYDPLFKDQNFGIFSVEAVNAGANTVTLNEPIETNNLDGTDLRVDTTVNLQHTGYNNPLNEGIVRYFDFASAPHDGYSTVAIKIVLLADSTTLVPKVDDYRVVGVTV